MITYSKEILYHFQCSECKKWWSIGDFKHDKYFLCCPYCEHKATPVELLNEEEKEAPEGQPQD